MNAFRGALALLFVAGAAGGQLPKDVPTGHWAKKDVEEAVKAGVLSAPSGKFGGEVRVTRSELIRAMASFGRSLEKSAWKPSVGKRSKNPASESAQAPGSPVTRYELAAVVARMGSYAAAGIPKAGKKRFGGSMALPKPLVVTTVKKTDPIFPSIDYLSKNRMIRPNSVLAKPGKEPITARDLGDAVAAVIAGVLDLHTDEPQNREEIAPPPGHDQGGPVKAPSVRR